MHKLSQQIIIGTINK